MSKQSNYDRYLKYNTNTGFKISDTRAVWIPDPEVGYVHASVESESGGKLKVKLGDGGSKTLDVKKCEPANPSKFDGVEDCAELSHLNDATVLHNLRVRYKEDLIHTSSGLFLVVVNPYKWIPVYTPEIIECYRNKRRAEVHPHVFAIADEAYRAMLRNHENQSMLITGESGAGKTENTKKVIQYMATIAGKADGNLEKQILQANPMLEAFGNAKTNKNDNSSRFGKFIRVQFNEGGIICGSTIQTYLLEKSRVTYQGRNERTFHIFYQILHAREEHLHLLKAHQYGFFSDKDAIRCKSLNDEEEWAHTLKAMEVVGLSRAEQDNIFRIISGIMHCGNIKFEAVHGSEGSKIADGDSLGIVAELWGLDVEQFRKAIVRPRIKAGLEIVEKHLTVEQAAYSVNAMCKSVYERLFLWLIQKLNKVLASATETNYIGVLDIAGFEIFENNSFEQLCINFTNEKLQQFFNEHMFKLEQEEYAREKIEWKYVDFGVDSQQTIDLIEKKPHSIMSLLDEESIFPRATNKTLITKLHTLEKKSPKYGTVQFKELNFKIAHYAGDVVYDVTNWIDKNKDPLQDDIAGTILDSKRPFVSNLFKDEELDARAAIAAKLAAESGKKKAQSGSGASFMTVATTYQEQLNDLMTTLRSTAPSFIRCIIPNLQKKPGTLQADLVLEQLRCNGVLEGIRISRMGFPNRVTYAQFLRRYYLLHPTLKRDDPEVKLGTEKIMQHLDAQIQKHFSQPDTLREQPLYQHGLTKIFFRHGVLAWLEERREQKLSTMVVQIQSAARGWIGRNAYKKINSQGSAAKVVQKNVKTWLKFREWIWWRMFVLSKPLLKSVGLDVMIAETAAEVERLEAAMKQLGADQEALGRQRDQKQQQLEKLREDLAAQRQKENESNSAVSGLARAVEKLNRDIEEKEEYLRKLRLGNSATDKDLADAEEELKQAEDNLAKTDKTNVALKDETTDQAAKLADLGKELNQLDRENDGRQNNVKRLDGEIQEAQRRLDNATKEGARLKGEIDDLESQIATQEDWVASLTKDRAALSSTISGLESDLQERKGELKQTKDDNEQLRKANKKLTGDIEDSTSKLDKATRENVDNSSKLKRTLNDLESTKQNADDQVSNKDKQLKQNSELEGAIASLKGHVGELEGSVRDAQKVKGDQTNRLAALRAQLESLEAQIAKLKKRIAELEAELAATEDKLDAQTVARGAADKEVKRLEDELRAVQEELEEALAKNANSSKHSAKLEKDIKDAQDHLKAASESNKRVDDEVKEKKARLAKAHDELNEAKRKGDAFKKDADKVAADAASVKSQAEGEAEARDRAERGQKSAEASLTQAKAELTKLEQEAQALNENLKKKKSELEAAQAKAAQAGAAEERRKAATEAKKTQQELNDLLDQITKAEAGAKAGERRKAALEREVAEMKAENERSAKRQADIKKRRADAEAGQGALQKQAADLDRANKKAQQDLDDVLKVLKAVREAVKKCVKVSSEGKVDLATSVFHKGQSATGSRAASRPAEASHSTSHSDSTRESSRLSRFEK